MRTSLFEKYAYDKQKFMSEIIDMRCQGISYDDITKKLNTTLQFVYTTCNFLAEEEYLRNKPYLFLRLSLPSTYKNLTIPQLARETGLSIKGLLCVLCDLKLLRKPDKEVVLKLLGKGADIKYLCDYYGVSFVPMKTWMRENGLAGQAYKEQRQSGFNASDWVDTAIPLDEIIFLSGEELNPQYSRDFDNISMNSGLVDAFKHDKELTDHAFVEIQKNNTLLDASKEYFSWYYPLYSRWQYGIASPDNFFYRTMAPFKECTRPCRKPDYVVVNSENNVSKSLYWFSNKQVIRGSYLWGRNMYDPGDCDWYIVNDDGTFKDINFEYNGNRKHPAKVYGVASWTDFVYKSEISKIRHK